MKKQIFFFASILLLCNIIVFAQPGKIPVYSQGSVPPSFSSGQASTTPAAATQTSTNSSINVSGSKPVVTSFKYNSKDYNVFIIKVDSSNLRKLSILENRKTDPSNNHDNFYNGLKQQGGDFFIINACFNDSIGNPLGYYANNSKKIQDINSNGGNGEKQSFYLTPNGALIFNDTNAVICESSQINSYAQSAVCGIQNGPMLVSNKIINQRFGQNSPNVRLRAGVGMFCNKNNEKFLIFAMSVTQVTFYEFASFFKYYANCDNALCLGAAGVAFATSNFNTGLRNNQIYNYLYYKY